MTFRATVARLQRQLLAQPGAIRCPRCAMVLLAPPVTCPHCRHPLAPELTHAPR